MNIKETVNMNGNITIKQTDTTTNQTTDVICAYLSASIDTGSNNISISINIQNKDLLDANSADAQAQYTDFETAVKSRVKELGFTIFA